MKKLQKKTLDLQKWVIRLCALSMASGLYLVASTKEEDKDNVKIAVVSSACAVLGGIGMGIANYKLYRGRN